MGFKLLTYCGIAMAKKYYCIGPSPKALSRVTSTAPRQNRFRRKRTNLRLQRRSEVERAVQKLRSGDSKVLGLEDCREYLARSY